MKRTKKKVEEEKTKQLKIEKEVETKIKWDFELKDLNEDHL